MKFLGAVWTISVCCLSAASALAQENTTTLGREEKKFFPLKNEKQVSLAAHNNQKSAGFRSDKDSIAKGFMRIDRGASLSSDLKRRKSPMIVTPENNPIAEAKPPTLPNGDAMVAHAEAESEEIAGVSEAYNDPVLSLFDNGASAPLSNFREALLAGAPHVALTRHPVWPVPLRYKQYVSSGYGMRTDPFTRKPAFHGGIDIVSAEGTPVVASADGNVLAVSSDANYGKYVSIGHADGSVSRYGHLSKQMVDAGQPVHAGQVIGAIGSTGRSTGAHLDFRVSKNNTKYDPLHVLSIPREVAFNDANKIPVPSPYTPRDEKSKIASNTTPKRPMVIQVR